jgi:hypothetical protein
VVSAYIYKASMEGHFNYAWNTCIAGLLLAFIAGVSLGTRTDVETIHATHRLLHSCYIDVQEGESLCNLRLLAARSVQTLPGLWSMRSAP